MKRKKHRWWSSTYVGLVFAFLYVPIFVLIAFSFNESKSRNVFTGFTLDWYQKLFQNELIISALVNTLIVAAIASVVATILGTSAAIGINSLNKYLRKLVLNVTYMPIINPEIVTGVSLMLLFVFFKVSMGFTTLLLAHITFNVPYVIFSVMPRLRRMDQNLYDAALDLGCSPFLAFRKVVFPEILPGVLSGFLMAFTYSLDDFVISYFTAGTGWQTLPVAIFSMTRRRVSPEINALSTIIFVVVLTVLLLINIKDSRAQKRQKKGRVSA